MRVHLGVRAVRFRAVITVQGRDDLVDELLR